MCETAEEIQEDWYPQIGDKINVKWRNGSSTEGLQGSIIQDNPTYGISYRPSLEDLHIEIKDNENWLHHNGSLITKLIDDDDFEDVIFLPSQKQLQNMIVIDNYKFQFFMKKNIITFSWIHIINEDSWKIGDDSLEKCWLRFVMIEGYNKKWYNEKWMD